MNFSFQLFFKTCIDYNRLEKIDILGLHGARLSLELSTLYDEYLEEHKKFIEKNMDCLIPNDEVTILLTNIIIQM